MRLTSRRMGLAYVVKVEGARIDAAVAIQFKDQMRAETNAIPGRIILDLGDVDFVDSSGLGAIVASMKQMADNQTLELASLNPGVAKVFNLTRMDSVFVIHPSAETATGKRAG
ncbi:MAG: STAS domain-containing protein [Paracoccaceae bacterium]